MANGVVKLWNDDRGFGFIKPDGGGADVFAHVRNLIGADSLREGDRVRFEARPSSRHQGKLEAIAVALI